MKFLLRRNGLISRLEDLARSVLDINFGYSLSFKSPGANSACKSPKTVGDLGVESNSALRVEVAPRQSGRGSSAAAKVAITEATKAMKSMERIERKAEKEKKQKKLENEERLAAIGGHKNKKKKLRCPGKVFH